VTYLTGNQRVKLVARAVLKGEAEGEEVLSFEF
jgi:hypothetical protein